MKTQPTQATTMLMDLVPNRLVYKLIYDEGFVAGRRECILFVVSKLLGQPSYRVKAKLAKIDNTNQLGSLIERLFVASSWKDLIGVS